MKIINDPYVNELVNIMAAKSLLNTEGFVIAGGFATSLYDFYLKQTHEKEMIIRQIKNGFSGFALADTFLEKSDDIDYWVLTGSPAERELEYFFERDEDDKIKFISKTDNLAALWCKKMKDVSFTKATRFSISLHRADVENPLIRRRKHQIIRIKTYPKIKDVWADYDFALCKIAWSNNTLYVSSEAETDFAFCTIDSCKELSKQATRFQNVWSAMRFFKYHKRYGFIPTKKVVDELHDIFIDAVNFLSEDYQTKKDLSSKSLFGVGYAFPPVQQMVNAVKKYMPYAAKYNQTIEKEPYDAYKERSYNEMTRLYKSLLKEASVLFSFDSYSVLKATFLLSDNQDYEMRVFQDKLRRYIEAGGGKAPL